MNTIHNRARFFKCNVIPVLIVALAASDGTRMALGDSILYDFETGYIPASPLGFDITPQGFTISYSPGGLNTGQNLQVINATTSGLIGQPGAPFGGTNPPAPNHFLTTVGGLDNGLFTLDFTSSIVGDVSAVSLKAGSKGAGSATQLIASVYGTTALGTTSVYPSFPLSSFAGGGFAKYSTGVQINAADFGFSKINGIFFYFENAGGGIVPAQYMFDDINVTYAASVTPTNNSLIGLVPQSFDIPLLGSQPTLNVMRDPAHPLHSDTITIQRNGGTDAANFNLSLGSSGTSAFEFVSLTNPYSSTMASGTSSIPVSIQYHQDIAGHFTNTFNLQNTSNVNDLGSAHSVTYSLNVFDAPNVLPNNSSPIDTSAGIQTLTVSNPLGTSPLRAAAILQNVSVTGPFAIDSGIANTNQVAVNGTLSGHVAILASTTLNGTYHGSITVQYGPAGLSSLITDASLGSGGFTWNLVHTITGNTTGHGQAVIPAGTSYNSLNLDSNLGHGTKAQLLDGTAPAGGATVAIDFTTPSFALSGALGDALSLSGTSGSKFVLQLTYTAADLLAAGLQPTDPVDIMWIDPNDNSGHPWKPAVLGNSDHPLVPQTEVNRPYNAATDFTTLGKHGYYFDSGTGVGGAWAVLDHNSTFSLAQPVPEPGSLMLLGIGGSTFLRRRRMRPR